MFISMSLINQKLNYRYKKNYFNIKKKLKKNNTFALQNAPQAKGLVIRIRPMTPKKPNSAIRQVAKIKLYNKFRVTARMPGIGNLCTRYNRVLVEGGRANDLPGVKYTVIRGAYDFVPLFSKHRRRSIYGAHRPNNYSNYVRKCYRHIDFI